MDYYDDDLFDELSDELAHLPIDGQLAAVLEHITNPSLRHRRTAVKLLSLLSGALSKSTAATLLGMLEQSADAAQNEWGVRSSLKERIAALIDVPLPTFIHIVIGGIMLFTHAAVKRFSDATLLMQCIDDLVRAARQPPKHAPRCAPPRTTAHHRGERSADPSRCGGAEAAGDALLE